MWRVQRAINDPAVLVSGMLAVFAQVLFDNARIDMAASEQMDLNSFFYQPWPSAFYLLNNPDCDPTLLAAGWEDEIHKLKRFIAQIVAQPEHTPDGPEAEKLLVSKARLLDACGGGTRMVGDELVPVPHGFEGSELVKAAIHHVKTDDMCEWPAKLVTYSVPLQAALRAKGWLKDALALQILGEAHQAFTIPGFTKEWRDEKIAMRTDMVKQLMGSSRFDVALNRERPYSCELTRALLSVWAMNSDGRTHLLARHPGTEEVLCETSLSTDRVETFFGEVVNRAQYKPAYDVFVTHGYAVSLVVYAAGAD